MKLRTLRTTVMNNVTFPL